MALRKNEEAKNLELKRISREERKGTSKNSRDLVRFEKSQKTEERKIERYFL